MQIEMPLLITKILQKIFSKKISHVNELMFTKMKNKNTIQRCSHTRTHIHHLIPPTLCVCVNEIQCDNNMTMCDHKVTYKRIYIYIYIYVHIVMQYVVYACVCFTVLYICHIVYIQIYRDIYMYKTCIDVTQLPGIRRQNQTITKENEPLQMYIQTHETGRNTPFTS